MVETNLSQRRSPGLELPKKNRKNPLIFLAGLVLSAYLLFYTGKPISDDEQLFAVVTRNMAVTGSLSAEPLFGNLRIQGSYHGVEPAHPALAFFWLKMFKESGFGSTQILYFLPIFYTLLSCILIFLLAEQLGYSQRAGLIVALIFGLGTIALPYVKTFFRETLGGMIMLVMWFFLLSARSTKTWKRRGFLFASIACGVLLPFLKIAYISASITFGILLYLSNRNGGGRWIFWGSVLLLFWLVYSRNFTDDYLFYRLSGGFLRDAWQMLLYMPHHHFWEAMAGPFISPFKGILIYSPSVILSVLAGIRYGRSNLQLMIPPLVILCLLLLFQALTYDGQWWTPTWGARFLVPIIPLLLLMTLPLIEEWLSKAYSVWLILVCPLLTGFLLQIPAVFFNSSYFFMQTYNKGGGVSPNVYWDLLSSPLILQWRLLFVRSEFDMLIWRLLPYEPGYVFLIVLFAVLAGGVSILGIFSFVSNEQLPPFLAGRKIMWIPALIFVLFLSVLTGGRKDPFYRTEDFSALCNMLQSNIQKRDAVVIYSYPSDLWDYFSNVECGQGIWYSLPFKYYKEPGSLGYQIGEQVFSKVRNENFSRIWFISQYDHAPLSEFELNEFHRSYYQWVEDGFLDTPVPVYYSLYVLK